MMAFDMGGPLNKTAYAFATTGLGAAATATDAPELKVMAAVMLAGMVPPLALALATVIRPACSRFRSARTARPPGRMGASFITEGAIPFAAADPLRVIPPIMAGSAVTGALSMGLDVVPPGPARRHLRAVRRRRGPGLPHRPASPASLVAAALVVAAEEHEQGRPRPRYCLTT